MISVIIIPHLTFYSCQNSPKQLRLADYLSTNFLQNEQFSNSQTLLFVRHSVTLIKLLNKFKCSLSAYYVSVYNYSVYL